MTQENLEVKIYRNTETSDLSEVVQWDGTSAHAEQIIAWLESHSAQAQFTPLPSGPTPPFIKITFPRPMSQCWKKIWVYPLDYIIHTGGVWVAEPPYMFKHYYVDATEGEDAPTAPKNSSNQWVWDQGEKVCLNISKMKSIGVVDTMRDAGRFQVLAYPEANLHTHFLLAAMESREDAVNFINELIS